MAENGKLAEERTGKIEVHVCDQGHYGSSTCGECRHDLSNLDPMPTHCPNCKIKLNWGIPTYNEGGSDF
ncbi:MAG TPA: hypothetical protein VJJ02_02690 [Candidatus Paceibacterota bacterium]